MVWQVNKFSVITTFTLKYSFPVEFNSCVNRKLIEQFRLPHSPVSGLLVTLKCYVVIEVTFSRAACCAKCCVAKLQFFIMRVTTSARNNFFFMLGKVEATFTFCRIKIC